MNSTCPVTPSMAIVATAYVFLPRYTGAPPATHTEHDLGHLRARTPMCATGAPMTGQAWALECARARACTPRKQRNAKASEAYIVIICAMEVP